MKRFNSLMLIWIVSVVILSALEVKAETRVPCLIFSGKAEKNRNIDLSKLNRIRFGDNSMVLTTTKDAREPSEELQYSLYRSVGIGEAEPTITQAERIALSKETATLRVGQTVKLTASEQPETALNKTVRWTSSNSSVAQVDAEGRVTAATRGKTMITEKTQNGKSVSCEVEDDEPSFIFKIWIRDREDLEINLAESPKVYFSEGKMRLKTSRLEMELDKADVYKFTLENRAEKLPDSSGISEILYENNDLLYDEDSLVIKSQAPDKNLFVYDLQGHLIGRFRVSEDGNMEVKLSQLSRGIYIFKTETKTFKVIRK